MTRAEFEVIKDYMENGRKVVESRAEYESRIDEICHPNRMIRCNLLPYEEELIKLEKLIST